MKSRIDLIRKAYQHGDTLRIENHFYRDWLIRFINYLLSDDLGKGDITSDILIPAKSISHAIIKAKSSGTVAGVEESVYILGKAGLSVRENLQDGETFSPNDILMEIEGNSSLILRYERTVLNFLQRMSGIATLTRKFVEKVNSEQVGIAATRKTLWSLADKKAVFIGGGYTHRLGLYDAVLVKENHLSVFGDNSVETIREFLKKLQKSSPEVAFLEFEVKNMAEFEAAADGLMQIPGQIGIIMFDHFSPEDIRRAVQSRLPESHGNILYEASGNITLKNVRDYAASGADMLSVGTITHSAPGADFSLIIQGNAI